MRNPELWARLQVHHFDGPGSAPFSVKLARGEGWTAGFTARAIEEYRRFLYLTQVSAHQVTPSQTVDAVWHMHLTFTRDYWDDMCPNVIGRAIHHQPCAGQEDMPRYHSQFAATKTLYEAEFGQEPPADIWGHGKAMTARKLLVSEVGVISPPMIAFFPFAICLVLLILDPTLLLFAMTAFTGVMFFVVLLNPRRRPKRRTDRGAHQPEQDFEVFVDDDDGGEGPSSRGATSSEGRSGGPVKANKRSQENETAPDKDRETTRGGGIFGFFAGGNDDGDDGGGCGGCGD